MTMKEWKKRMVEKNKSNKQAGKEKHPLEYQNDRFWTWENTWPFILLLFLIVIILMLLAYLNRNT